MSPGFVRTTSARSGCSTTWRGPPGLPSFSSHSATCRFGCGGRSRRVVGAAGCLSRTSSSASCLRSWSPRRSARSACSPRRDTRSHACSWLGVWGCWATAGWSRNRRPLRPGPLEARDRGDRHRGRRRRLGDPDADRDRRRHGPRRLALVPHAARRAVRRDRDPLGDLYFFDPIFFASFYPANSEVLHAIPVLAFARDFLSPLMNLGFLGSACWRPGRLAAPTGSHRSPARRAVVVLGAETMTDFQAGRRSMTSRWRSSCARRPCW